MISTLLANADRRTLRELRRIAYGVFIMLLPLLIASSDFIAKIATLLGDGVV